MSKEAMKLALEDYLSREMPAGTVIGDPKWWAGKITNVLAKQEQGEPCSHPCGDIKCAVICKRHSEQEQGEPVVFEHSPWTRIEDAKPVVGQPVLVFYKGFAFPDTAVWTGVGCGWARDEEFDWQWDEVVNPITHWMPLPAGPDYHCTPTPQQRKPLTLEYIDQHIGADEGDREAVITLVREVEAAHGIKE